MSVETKPRELTRDELRERLRSLPSGGQLAVERPLTVEEFCELVDEDVNAELVNGVIQMSPPPSDAHEDLQTWLVAVLRSYVDARKIGKVRGSRSGIRVGATTLREPDVLFFSNASLDRMHPSGVHNVPDFVIEVVDFDPARRQAVAKQAQYELIGVPELWVIDLPWQELRHFALEEGRYRRLPVDPDGEVKARMIPGFRLKVAWLFQGPEFPNSLQVVTGLLRKERQPRPK